MTQQTKRWGAVAVVLLALVVWWLMRGGSEEDADTLAGPAPTAEALLQGAAEKIAGIRSLAFTMTANPVVPGMGIAAVSQGSGTVIWPDRIVFRGTMQSTPTLAAPVVIATCDTGRYIELGDGTFIPMSALPDVHRLLFAPDTGLVSGILTGLEQVSEPEAAIVEGVPTWRISGTIAERFLQTLPGRTQPATDSVRAELWIGQSDSTVRQATINGPMFDGDQAVTTRTFAFSGFDEPLPLTVPRGTNPCATTTS